MVSSRLHTDPIPDEAWAERTRHWISRFNHDIVELEANPPADIHPRLVKAQLDSLRSVKHDLESQLSEFEARRLT